MSRLEQHTGHIGPPGRPPGWSGPLHEVDRWQWRAGDTADPAVALGEFLTAHRVGREPDEVTTAVVLLAGATGCAAIAGLPTGAASPVPAVPDLVAVAVRRRGGAAPAGTPPAVVPREAWRTTWNDVQHADAVEQVRQAIARGDVYQANVVGHRVAAHDADPGALAAAVASLPGATYGGFLTGPGWAVGCASPEQLVRVAGDRISTVPVKGTRPVAPGTREQLLGSAKERAEHVMIVDLERNDLSRVAVTGSVEVDELFAVAEWSGLWHAASRVTARLREDVGVLEVLRALLPGGSVTGAPKHAACSLLAELEPVGRGPAMGAFGMLWPGGLELGLTIRTLAADAGSVHLWAGGGITWDSDPAAEVAEAHAKAEPLLRAMAGQVRPSTS
ncbi:MAG TPA: anthranilate synthase component I family protein [Mycobacteriales bacterium]|nr:anthranilate synthase component I family protein [Mycobacteriales bacterium]